MEPLIDTSHINNVQDLPVQTSYANTPAPRENRVRVVPSETFAPKNAPTIIEDYQLVQQNKLAPPIKQVKVLYSDLDNDESVNPYIPFSIPISTTWMDKRFATHNKHFSDMKKLDKLIKFEYPIEMERYLHRPLSMRHSWCAKGGLSIKRELLAHTK
jgi:hypothetical protein